MKYKLKAIVPNKRLEEVFDNPYLMKEKIVELQKSGVKKFHIEVLE